LVETDRVVHVWKVLADWSRVGSVRNVKTCERGWGFVQPTEGGNGSVCMSYNLVSPTVSGVVPLRDNRDGIRSLIELNHRFAISRLQTLENHTLEQCIQDERLAATSSADGHVQQVVPSQPKIRGFQLRTRILWLLLVNLSRG
jgi:hypothetical protein